VASRWQQKHTSLFLHTSGTNSHPTPCSKAAGRSGSGVAFSQNNPNWCLRATVFHEASGPTAEKQISFEDLNLMVRSLNPSNTRPGGSGGPVLHL